MPDLVSLLCAGEDIPDSALAEMISSSEADGELAAAADKVRRKYYGKDVYTRGLIEFTNFCKNDCFYCGIRRSNSKAERYRLSRETILECCRTGYRLGFRTFVLQGGEDPYYTDDMICGIVYGIKNAFPDCAVTLSIGEKSRAAYKAYFDSGADRYLLRHETAGRSHYSKLHPASMSFDNRRRCLFDLKEIGYQVGAGFMTGSPFQTADDLVSDIRFMQELSPDMIGIGPFIPHGETPFADKAGGTLELALRMISIVRLMFPYALIPATTALGTIHPQGRELGLKAGANVVMPNLSPKDVRKAYSLYDNKICTGEEAAECRHCLDMRIKAAGYETVLSRGDVRRELA